MVSTSYSPISWIQCGASPQSCSRAWSCVLWPVRLEFGNGSMNSFRSWNSSSCHSYCHQISDLVGSPVSQRMQLCALDLTCVALGATTINAATACHATKLPDLWGALRPYKMTLQARSWSPLG